MIFCYSSYPYLISDHCNAGNSSSSQLTRALASRNRMWGSLSGYRCHGGAWCQSLVTPLCSVAGAQLMWGGRLMWALGRVCSLWHRWGGGRTRHQEHGPLVMMPASLWRGATSETRGKTGDMCRYLVVFRKYFDEESISCLWSEVSSLRGYSRSHLYRVCCCLLLKPQKFPHDSS